MDITRALQVLLLGLAFWSLPAHALVQLHFDDGLFSGPTTDIQHPAGVRFTTGPTGIFSYGEPVFAPFALHLVNGQVLQIRSATVLDIAFSAPALSLAFDAAHNAPASFVETVPVTLFKQEGGFETRFLSLFSFSGEPAENSFAYSATGLGSSVTRLVISFPGSGFDLDPLVYPDRFALDNLIFQPVPEPSTALLMSGLLAIAWVFARRRKA
jgi:PEP-CTERM motif